MGSAIRRSRREPQAAERLLATALASGRLAIGAGIWIAPRSSLAGLGFKTGVGSATRALARVAATRDLVLGVWQLRSLGDRAELRRASVAVAIADAGDALTFGLLLNDPENRAAAVRGILGATPATIAGAWLASRL